MLQSIVSDAFLYVLQLKQIDLWQNQLKPDINCYGMFPKSLNTILADDVSKLYCFLFKRDIPCENNGSSRICESLIHSNSARHLIQLEGSVGVMLNVLSTVMYTRRSQTKRYNWLAANLAVIDFLLLLHLVIFLVSCIDSYFGANSVILKDNSEQGNLCTSVCVIHAVLMNTPV